MSGIRKADTKDRLVAVFEAVNDSLREAYLGTTEHPVADIAARFPQNLPSAASHWEPGHRIAVNIIDPSLRLEDALTFIRHYAAGMEAAGWKALREDD